LTNVYPNKKKKNKNNNNKVKSKPLLLYELAGKNMFLINIEFCNIRSNDTVTHCSIVTVAKPLLQVK
jgi:hypothetical protein